ncbi:LOW QUALITY PROTEIN: calmodulin-regulated spectrin-associated protein 1-like [Aotus nancymaae]|uniref:LOW QUALITY PROTEIN: calmodulin-regulated spectrin-associated protein 1-like n=1 Tax=Aotus nancymaae TaxID=37293 RepID=UPI0030FE8253
MLEVISARQCTSKPAYDTSCSGRPAELKVPKDRPQGSSGSKTPTPSVETLPHLRPFPASSHPRTPTDPSLEGAPEPSGDRQRKCLFDSYRLHNENNQRTLTLSSSKDANILLEQMSLKEVLDASVKEAGPGSSDISGKESVPVEEPLRSRASLTEVDLSDLKAPDEDGELASLDGSADLISEGDQKPGVGFFFKDEQKAEDELAKKRAAFLLKQERKAEEARVRKQQLEAEVELKRDEARRKAEEDRVRKEEEKAWLELIKQENLRRKQQQILEEQGLGKPKKPRPKSVHREESCSDSGTKCFSTPDNLSWIQSGSSLSLASAATTEPESVHSGGTPSQRVESMEAFPILSRNLSRSTDRDWETASAASSVASVALYTGPKLFKEPRSKSNKPNTLKAIGLWLRVGIMKFKRLSLDRKAPHLGKRMVLKHYIHEFKEPMQIRVELWTHSYIHKDGSFSQGPRMRKPMNGPIVDFQLGAELQPTCSPHNCLQKGFDFWLLHHSLLTWTNYVATTNGQNILGHTMTPRIRKEKETLSKQDNGYFTGIVKYPAFFPIRFPLMSYFIFISVPLLDMASQITDDQTEDDDDTAETMLAQHAKDSCQHQDGSSMIG